jgi:hypothetical protein
MTDRELLELAAKAAGYQYLWNIDSLLIKGLEGHWNPLTDDGDALRLAVKLRMVLDTSTGDDIHVQYPFGTNYYPLCEEGDPDPYAATRRAIVRAAAEIGRDMK